MEVMSSLILMKYWRDAMTIRWLSPDRRLELLIEYDKSLPTSTPFLGLPVCYSPLRFIRRLAICGCLSFLRFGQVVLAFVCSQLYWTDCGHVQKERLHILLVSSAFYVPPPPRLSELFEGMKFYIRESLKKKIWKILNLD